MKANEILKTLTPGTQNYIVLNDLIKVGYMTSMNAFTDHGITRLAARISDLREMGVEIASINMVKDGNHYAKYVLEGE